MKIIKQFPEYKIDQTRYIDSAYSKDFCKCSYFRSENKKYYYCLLSNTIFNYFNNIPIFGYCFRCNRYKIYDTILFKNLLLILRYKQKITKFEFRTECEKIVFSNILIRKYFP